MPFGIGLRGGRMQGVVNWFEQRGEIPLVPPPRLREYSPISDDPDRAFDDSFSESISGVAFGIEYCDSHGWMSTRTIRCLAIDPHHPASLQAFCNVRQRIVTFRIDRIISIIDLRSGRVLSSNEHLSLLSPYLASEEPGGHLRALSKVQHATRDGLFVILQLAMPDGMLVDAARDIAFDYVRAEAERAGCLMPPSSLVELWIDNLAPPLESVIGAMSRLLADRDTIARLLPYLLKLARGEGSPAGLEYAMHGLVSEVREYFKRDPNDFPTDLRAMR